VAGSLRTPTATCLGPPWTSASTGDAAAWGPASRFQARYGALNRAYIHLGLSEFDEAFKRLERAYLERAGLLVHIKVEPLFALLSSDFRYADLLRRVGRTRAAPVTTYSRPLQETLQD